jgi:ABC-type Fe3+/spermidine/putrescine transport system ATPase subunit
VTTLLVTHDQDEALSLSDWIVVLDRGRVQQTGPPDEAYRRPANRFVADFLGAANLFEGELRQRGDAFEVTLAGGQAIPVARPPEAVGRRVCVLLRPERIALAPNGDGLPAIVVESAYHGQMVRYHLRLAGGREVVAMATDAVPRFAPASPVRLSWRPEDVWVMAEPEADPTPDPWPPEASRAGTADNQDRISHGRVE